MYMYILKIFNLLILYQKPRASNPSLYFSSPLSLGFLTVSKYENFVINSNFRYLKG